MSIDPTVLRYALQDGVHAQVGIIGNGQPEPGPYGRWAGDGIVELHASIDFGTLAAFVIDQLARVPDQEPDLDPFPREAHPPVLCAHCGAIIFRTTGPGQFGTGAWKHQGSGYRGCLPDMATNAEP